MFKNLIPWKKHNDKIAVRHDDSVHGEDRLRYPSRFRGDFDSLFGQLLDDPWRAGQALGLSSFWNESPFHWNWDLGWEDQGEKYVFRAELPGFESEDFDIKVRNNLLTVRAEHKSEEKGDRGCSSYRYGTFSRTFSMPAGVDHERIDARYHSGVLELHLPKTKEAQGKRIEVKAG